ncbi:DUF4011 domain-containing protein [Pseudoglutamicibacter albus]|uniref:DUF4011 domain-containing protein n=1 Tax=Pseudoglutamicibacter albus TaxID=98671 RepID=UPI0018DECC9D|nr:DUF4011 domain-containing protein [Pseudoglutamicibacter albus]
MSNQVSVQQTPETRFRDWVQSLSGSAGTDSLLRFVPTEKNAVELTHAHRSGLAQFLTGRRTRLSTLLRDPVQYKQARSTVRAIATRVREISESRGVDVGYVAAGLVTWRTLRSGRTEYYSSPLMLGRVSLQRRDGVDDEELQLMGRAVPNETLLRFLNTSYGLDIHPDDVLNAGYRTARFNPTGPVNLLRDIAAKANTNIVIEDRVCVSTIATASDPVDPSVVSVNHPIIAALLDEFAPVDEDAGASYELATKVADIQEADTGYHEVVTDQHEGIAPQLAQSLVDDVLTPGADDRDPADELLVTDVDDDAYAVLDAVSKGKSVTVSAPPGSERINLAVNAAARLAADGKRVLIVAERESTIQQVTERFARVSLDTTLVKLDRNADPEVLRERLTDAILRNERTHGADSSANDSVARAYRGDLVEHIRSLHSVRSRWGASPLDAMQELARLSSGENAPATTVRLKRSVLDAMPDRAPVVEQLQRVAELGGFSQESLDSPWYGSRLRNRGEAEAAVALVNELADSVPDLCETLENTAASTRIKPVESFAQWGDTLRLLVAVRRSLDLFEPDIFDKPVDDLIAATAPSQWRRERGVEMSAMTRSRLRRVAKEYVRPGVHIDDLHTALTQVREQRVEWESLATDNRYPSIPAGLERVLQTFRNVLSSLNQLQSVLPDHEARLDSLPTDALQQRLALLQEKKSDLETLPERTLLMETLREKGLGELLDDFAQRHVKFDALEQEVELAWWQSVLEAMISGDDYLALQSSEELEKIREEFERADALHIVQGADRVAAALAYRWKAAIADHRVGARDMRALLKVGDPTPQQLAALAPAVVGSATPVWVGAPLYLPTVLPRWSRFDAAILLDAESLALESSLTTISRVDQVLAIGDPNTGVPLRLNVEVDKPLNAGRGEDTPLSAFEALNRVTLRRSLRRNNRVLDERFIETLSAQYEQGMKAYPTPATAESSVELIRIEHPHAPAGRGTVTSTPTEVEKVVRLMFEQLTQHPHRSLAVIAGTAEHAQQLARGISNALPHHPNAMPAFQRRYEPFIVTSADRVDGLRRDSVIFSLGFANSPQGRQPQHFGELNSRNGLRYVMTSVSAARSRLYLVCALSLEELEERMVVAHSGPLEDKTPARSGMELLTRLMRSVEEPRTYQLLRPAFKTATQTETPTLAASWEQHSADEAQGQQWHVGALMADLSQRLQAYDLIVIQHPGFGVDMAVYGPVWLKTAPLAISVDSSPEYAQQSVRSRTRIVPEALENRGWKPVQLWTIDVFKDPDAVARDIASQLGVDVPGVEVPEVHIPWQESDEPGSDGQES